MADIRIKDLATTASSTASDDFLAVDGSANGTRKLNAYSPTFGGNVTASNNLTVGGDVTLSTNNTYLKGKTSGGSSVNLLSLTSDTNNLTRFIAGVDAGGFQWTNQAQSAAWASLTSSLLTVTGNLTVSGGTITSGSGTLTLNSSANTVVLQSAGTTALTLDSSQNATFAGWASIRGTGSGSAQWIGDDGSDGWFLNVPTSNVITLGINNTARMVIKANTVQIVNLPTSSSGLTPGDLWNDSGTVKIA